MHQVLLVPRLQCWVQPHRVSRQHPWNVQSGILTGRNNLHSSHSRGATPILSSISSAFARATKTSCAATFRPWWMPFCQATSRHWKCRVRAEEYRSNSAATSLAYFQESASLTGTQGSSGAHRAAPAPRRYQKTGPRPAAGRGHADRSRRLILALALAETDQAAHQVELALLEGAGHAAKVAAWVDNRRYEIL